MFKISFWLTMKSFLAHSLSIHCHLFCMSRLVSNNICSIHSRSIYVIAFMCVSFVKLLIELLEMNGHVHIKYVIIAKENVWKAMTIRGNWFPFLCLAISRFLHELFWVELCHVCISFRFFLFYFWQVFLIIIDLTFALLV